MMKTAGSGGGARKGWLLRTLLVFAVGVGLGVAIVVAALVREAQVTVAKRLEGEVWSEPGRVWSGPVEVWSGVRLTPDELARDLRSAGYTEVAEVRQPGDFKVTADAVVVHTAAQQGPGWQVKEQEVLVSFGQGVVRSVTPHSPVRLAPAVLATLAGPSAERRDPVPLDAIPDSLQDAVLVMEDARFYDHKGLSLLGVLRAMVVNLNAGGTVQGGSTLTQQLAKNLFLTPERTVARKAREAFLALAIEQRLSKDQILELYLNGVYLGQAGGQAIHGVAEAARVYYGKPVGRLTLGECAMLGGIISAPNQYSPLRNPEAARTRRDLVLRRLRETDRITEAQEKKALAEDLTIHPTAIFRAAPWGVDRAVAEAEDRQGEGSVTRDGLEVWTSLSPVLQRLAERSLAEGLAEVLAEHPEARGVEAALLAVAADSGEILALVGGRDYARSSFDRASLATRQVGSLVKPLTLVAALDADKSLTLDTTLDDSPIERTRDGRSWKPVNHDGVFKGPVTVHEAVVHSRNIPCILLAERVGMKKLKKFWQDAGLSQATAWPASSLGAFDASPVEVAEAYTIFANKGVVRDPWLVRSVVDAEGRVLWKTEARSRTVATARSVALARQVLSDVIREGTGAGARRHGVGDAAAGKTGTTDAGRDAWFAGLTPDLVTVVWVGFDEKKAHGLSGAQAALPIWARFVAGSGTSGGQWAGGDDLVSVEVCVESGLPATSDCPRTRTAYFAPDHAPTGTCALHGGARAGADEEKAAARARATGKAPEPEAPTRSGLVQRIKDAIEKREKQKQ